MRGDIGRQHRSTLSPFPLVQVRVIRVTNKGPGFAGLVVEFGAAAELEAGTNRRQMISLLMEFRVG